MDSGLSDGERAIAQVLAVEFDELLRGVLHDLLTTVHHYAVTEVTTEAAALDSLASSPEGVGAVWSKRHPDHYLSTAFFAAVVADKRSG